MTTLVTRAKSPRSIVGYCWPWTVRPADQVKFMVSCENEGTYRADLVRIICADNLSHLEMFKEQEIESPFNGHYPGLFQPTHPGSYVEIAPQPVLDRLTSFSAQAMVYPTLLPGGVRVRPGGVPNSCEEPVLDDQHIISRWDRRTKRGWGLLINKEGCAAFIVGTPEATQAVVLDRPLSQDRWYLLAGGVDVDSGCLYITAQEVGYGRDKSFEMTKQEETFRSSVPQAGVLRFAACTDGPGNGPRQIPAHCFNGRLDRVRLIEGSVTSADSMMLAGTTIPPALRSRIIGFWDFAQDVANIPVTDLSVNALHGTTVNLPTRGVRGVDWDGSVCERQLSPSHYSAIHFHDDDLYDAEWERDFTYTIPEDLPSGIYAARLRHRTCEEYIPFFVAPPRGSTRASVALLLPTMTYTAYTNVTGLTAMKRVRDVQIHAGERSLVEEDLHPDLKQERADADFLLANHRRLGKGIYANHVDGTLKCTASQRHPNMTIKPKGINWTLVADTYLTDWLEQKHIAYDVITDDLLQQEGFDLLKSYTVVMTGNHPEYYTRKMLTAVDQYQRAGGRWMYLGGNGFFWVTSVNLETPGAIEVRKDTYAGHLAADECRHAFDGESGGRWENNGRPPSLLVGSNYDLLRGYAMEGGAPYRRLADSYSARAAFIFEGVSGDTFGEFGLFGGGAAGQEVDTIDKPGGTPPHALHLARADAFPKYGTQVSKDAGGQSRGPLCDVTFHETARGGAVFSVGSMSWVGALSHNDYKNSVSSITENVLRRFMQRAAFTYAGPQQALVANTLTE